MNDFNHKRVGNRVAATVSLIGENRRLEDEVKRLRALLPPEGTKHVLASDEVIPMMNRPDAQPVFIRIAEQTGDFLKLELVRHYCPALPAPDPEAVEEDRSMYQALAHNWMIDFNDVALWAERKLAAMGGGGG